MRIVIILVACSMVFSFTDGAYAQAASGSGSDTPPMPVVAQTAPPAAVTPASAMPLPGAEKSTVVSTTPAASVSQPAPLESIDSAKQKQDMADLKSKTEEERQALFDADNKQLKQIQDALDEQAKRLKKIDAIIKADQILIERRENLLTSEEKAAEKRQQLDARLEKAVEKLESVASQHSINK